MDVFLYASKVRLRSSSHGKYLAADTTNSVFQARPQHPLSDLAHSPFIWEVKHFRDNSSAIRLRSAYAGFLTGSDHKFLLGWKGNKVIQTNPTRADHLSEWEPIQSSEHRGTTLVKLRTRAGTYLRANGGAPPWRNSVTHDRVDESEDRNLLWEVEVVEEKDYTDPHFY